MLGRVDVQTDDVLELGGELGIGRALEGADAVRLEVVGGPDALHGTQGDARVSGHRPAGPVGRLAGRLGAGQGHDPPHGPVAQRRLARLAAGVAQQPLDPSFGEPPLPAPHRRPADSSPLGHSRDRQPLGRCQDDPSPRHVLLGAITIGDDRLQTSTILDRDQRTDDLSHEPNVAHPPALVNRLFASVH